MFSFHKQSAQAKKKDASRNDFEFRWRAIYTWIIVLVPLLGGLSYLVQNHTLLPIKTIQLTGTFQHIDQSEVESALRPFVGSGFFSLDIQKVRSILSEKSWTESVSIRRVWPDRLVIRIVEKKPVARWDNKHLISDQARIYQADTKLFPDLPIVHAMNSSPIQVLRQYYDFVNEFNKLEETIVMMQMDSRNAIDIELASGLKIKVGHDDAARKVARLITIYEEQILPRRDNIKQLDLRYSNGIAVAWKKEALESNDLASIWGNNNV